MAVSRHDLARAVTGCDQHVIVPAQRSGALLRHRCSACVRARTHTCMCCARVASAGLLSRRERAAASSRKPLDGRNGALVRSPARTRCKRMLAVSALVLRLNAPLPMRSPDPSSADASLPCCPTPRYVRSSVASDADRTRARRARTWQLAWAAARAGTHGSTRIRRCRHATHASLSS